MESNMFKQVGNNILQILEDKKLSQQFLANKLQISRQVMSKIIGGNKATNVVEISRIAQILDVPVGSLLDVACVDEPTPEYSFMGQVFSENTKKKIRILEEVIDELIQLERFADVR